MMRFIVCVINMIDATMIVTSHSLNLLTLVLIQSQNSDAMGRVGPLGFKEVCDVAGLYMGLILIVDLFIFANMSV